jgi:hypothetical protein
MTPPLDWLGTGPKRGTTKTSSLLAFAVLVTPLPGVGDQLAPRPPSSIEPRVSKQHVLFSHLHRRVRACTPVPNEGPTSCAPRLSDASAATSVFLEPVATANGAPSRNRGVVVTFADVNGLQKQSVEIPVGEWTIEWPGCREMGRLAISAARGVAPRVALRTTTGSCELSADQCRLHAGATEQRLAIEE